MRQARCKQCGAPINLGADIPPEKRVCAYCGAPISLAQLRRAQGPGMGKIVGLAAAVIFLGAGVGVAMFVGGGKEPTSPDVLAKVPDPPTPAPPPPAVPPLAPEPKAAPEPPPPPPREPTVNDRIREHLKKAGGKLCVAGNLSRFGPFIGQLSLAVHADGRVTGFRGEMQPRSPKVIKCMREKLSSGPTFEGDARAVVYHFSGGRNPDGVQYRDGVEFKGTSAEPAGAETPSVEERGPQEKEGAITKVESYRGGGTMITSRGVRRIRGKRYYAVEIRLPDGDRVSFSGMLNKLRNGSKVMVRYVAEGGVKSKLELPIGNSGSRRPVKGQLLPRLKPTSIGDETYSITFPTEPQEKKTDLGTLYSYDYKFHKSYAPDSFYFFRTAAEGNGSRKFFNEQTSSLLALIGGTRVVARIKAGRRDRKTGLKKATGSFELRTRGYTPGDGLIHLWFDAKKKMLYGAWVIAYSRNRLNSDKAMKRDFFGSFTLK